MGIIILQILIGDYLLSRCFEIMVEDGNLEVLKLLSSTSSVIAQGEVLQLQHKGEVDMLGTNLFKNYFSKNCGIICSCNKGGCNFIRCRH